MPDLKPCPFCGSASIEPPRECEAAWCRKCFASGPVPSVYAMNEFVAAWNQRAGWRDISSAPKDDRTIMRPHVIWGPMTVQRNRFKQDEFLWMNPGMATVWPEDAFLPFWMPVEVPDCPLCGLKLTGGCRCGKAPALPTLDELPKPPKEGGANG